MNGIERLGGVFSEARSKKRGVLMPFVVGGHPVGVPVGEMLHALQRAGAGVVEIGFAFSDPIADGSVIAQAMHESLEAGQTVRGLLDEVAKARASLTLGIVAMVSVSLVHRNGGAAFVRTLAEAGFDGVIVPDVTLEASGALRAAATEAGIGFALLIAPSTPPARAAEIAQACSGFVYLLARAGITGEQSETPQITGRVSKLRQAMASGGGGSGLPIAVGFGISTAEHVRGVVADADAAIVGSALVRRLAGASDPVGEAERFCAELAKGLEPGGGR
jgi:tryptophan synthase alpha chain